MLLSFVIFHKGGLVLYQHLNEASSTGSSVESLTNAINTWLSEIYFNPTISKTLKKNTIQVDDDDTTISSRRTIVEWEETSDLIAMAVYPDLRHEDFPWIRNLLTATLYEFQIFIKASSKKESATSTDTSSSNCNDDVVLIMTTVASPENQSSFDRTFQVLFQRHRNNTSTGDSTSAAKSIGSTSKNNPPGKQGGKGKEKRQWHDGKAKVTKGTMAELDRSKAVTEDDILKSEEQALAEARAAYLPTDADLEEFHMEDTTTLIDADDEDDDDGSSSSSSSWGKSLSGLFAQMTGQKVLTKQDLEVPLKEMHRLLTSKNVAADIASQVCDKVQESLVGKKLNSMYRVKTAVRQALEKVINELLLPSTQLDLLRQVVSKRDRASSLFARSKNQRPYVIVVVGINGVGKSTSLAKLAYYLKSNGCKPLLAACDTFRSGAVEQLGVHAKCLGLPIYSKGYSKDPSSVAMAAIEQASQNGNDVVLVDTAGRMQNNLPLMKALGKLTFENQPDTVVFVGEALVGNDGVDQVKMFDKAVSFQSKSQKVDAILLTKFDTVSDKVGAALTMTHVTNAPILFVGTGQKYHHLQKLSTASVIKSLFQ
ncbi:signal recognition particle receptor [Nitzschia inconspicua]|uniref:Signal recognition particle receptor subunit alpha homolog n=1 Tax=Nitzschia inconspicua TaxID=303405 RepID=A0A9K3KAS4_9STRA|nr:signal recognition particle receptor [Nitzschia inconspicua]